MTSGNRNGAPRAAAVASKEVFRIRQVVAEDLPALATMVAALAAADGRTANATPEDLGRDLLAPDTSTWLATIIGERAGDGIPLGYAIMFRTYDINHAKKKPSLLSFSLYPKHVDMASVLRSAREQAHEWGCTTLQLRVDSENWSARRFYKSQGVTERSHGRLRYMLVRLARILGFKRRLQIELVASSLMDGLSLGSSA
jgi:hypothetical protein